MKHCQTLGLGLLAAACLQSSPAAFRAGSGEETRPNIVLILADDVSAGELSPYGGAIAMPNLQKLADGGILFKNGWSTPLCSPSRAMLMTGKYPRQTGYWENAVSPSVLFEHDPRHLPLLQMMREAGYATCMAGKKHLGDAELGSYGADDWLLARYWDGYDGPKQNSWVPDRSGMYGVSWYWHPGLIRNGKGVPTTPDDFGPDLELEHILKFSAANKGRSWMVHWATNLPHAAHDETRPGPQQWYYTDVPEVDASGKRTGGRVDGSLKSTMQYLDHLLGRLRDGLAKEGLASNTIIIFTADNGTANVDKGTYRRDDAIRVPFVAGGGPVKPRGPSDVLVDFTDLWPTCARLAAYQGAMNTDGHSFAAYLLGGPFTPREIIRMAMNNARWIRDQDWLLDGTGRFYDTRGAANRDEYRDVSTSDDPEVVAARRRFETYLRDFPLPDEKEPNTAASWKAFRASPAGAPVEVFRPAYLE
jgi:arylsulfatase A-like enzyme